MNPLWSRARASSPSSATTAISGIGVAPRSQRESVNGAMPSAAASWRCVRQSRRRDARSESREGRMGVFMATSIRETSPGVKCRALAGNPRHEIPPADALVVADGDERQFSPPHHLAHLALGHVEHQRDALAGEAIVGRAARARLGLERLELLGAFVRVEEQEHEPVRQLAQRRRVERLERGGLGQADQARGIRHRSPPCAASAGATIDSLASRGGNVGIGKGRH